MCYLWFSTHYIECKKKKTFAQAAYLESDTWKVEYLFMWNLFFAFMGDKQNLQSKQWCTYSRMVLKIVDFYIVQKMSTRSFLGMILSCFFFWLTMT